MSSGSGLPPPQHAAFAVMSRLISCLVTEQILRALYISTVQSPRGAGILVVLSTRLISEKIPIDRPLHPGDIFALVPLRNSPVFIEATIHKHGRLVGLVDPLDMCPEIFELSKPVSTSLEHDDLRCKIMSCLAPPSWELGNFTTLIQITNPVHLWQKFINGVVIQSSLRTAIQEEIQSSFYYQLLAYHNPPECPSLISTPIEWEQSLVAGHPTHPMHRARTLLQNVLGYDWYHPKLRFARVAQSELTILGPFVDKLRKLSQIAAQKSGRQLPVDPSSILMPVHELQIPNIRRQFPHVEILHHDIHISGLAQSSIRTIVVPELPGFALKLAVGVKISSSLRTISHFTADFGPRFSMDILPQLNINPNILSTAREISTAVHNSADPDVAKHLTVVLREEFQPKEGQTLIVCAALLEMDHAGAPVGMSAVEKIFSLDTDEKRATFLDRYIEMACQALLPPLIDNGVAFEAHAQNVLARFDTVTGDLLGFVIRDLGGLRIHPETLHQSTGVNFKFLPGHCIVTKTLEETYPKFYHTFVHNHIQRLIRILKMHCNGRGWEMLRRHMDAVIPVDHPLRKIWLSPDSKVLPSKSLLRMRMGDSYRETVYSTFPNMIQYRGDAAA